MTEIAFEYKSIREAEQMFGPRWRTMRVAPAPEKAYRPPDFLFGPEPNSLQSWLSLDLFDIACFEVRDARVGAESTVIIDNVVLIGQEVGLIEEWIPVRVRGRPAPAWFVPTNSVDRAVLLTAPGHAIFGHWLIDFLPRLYVLHRTGFDIFALKYLVPRDTPGFALEFLDLLGISRENIVFYDRDNDVVQVSELLLPMNLRAGSRVHPLIRDAAAFLLRVISTRNLLPETPVPSPKIFIVRRGEAGEERKLINREKIEAIATDYGYVLVDPLRFSILQQISLFMGAKVVVGEYGSGLHTAMFAPAGTIIGCIRGSAAHPGYVQSSLGEELSQLVGYVIGHTEGEIGQQITVRKSDARKFFSYIDRLHKGTDGFGDDVRSSAEWNVEQIDEDEDDVDDDGDAGDDENTMNDSDYQELTALVFRGDYHILAEQRIAPHFTWVNAVQTEVILIGADVDLDFPRQPLPPYPAVAIVMMVKDEKDIILDNLRWSYFTGVRRFAVMDNASSDGTWRILEYFRDTFRDAEVVLVSDPTIRHMQAEKTTGLFRLAQSYWPDLEWVFPTDADEFLVPMRGFASLEEVSPEVDALTIPKAIHFRPRGLESARPIPGMPLRSKLFCVAPKVVVRANPILSLTQGNHHVEQPDAKYAGALQYGFYHREFPNRSFEHLLTKIQNGGRAIIEAQKYLGRGVGGEHWLAYYEALQRGGEAELREIYERDWCKDAGDDLIMDPFDVPGDEPDSGAVESDAVETSEEDLQQSPSAAADGIDWDSRIYGPNTTPGWEAAVGVLRGPVRQQWTETALGLDPRYIDVEHNYMIFVAVERAIKESWRDGMTMREWMESALTLLGGGYAAMSRRPAGTASEE